MSDISVDVLTTMLFDTIEAKDINKTLMLVVHLKEKIKSDAVAVKWLSEPANLKRLHDALIEHLDIPQKVMLIKGRFPHRQQRALLFIEAIEGGIRKVING
jgi:2-phospho-L-lactate guanylyltransferase (CobY/MobA/RfbA family)